MNKLTLGLITVAIALIGFNTFLTVQQKIETAQPKLGVSSPDINSPYFSYGDVRHWGAFTQSLNSGSATICSLQSPAATSTLTFAGVKLNTASTTALFIELGKGASATATTTSLGTANLAGGQTNATIIASDSEGGLDTDHVFAPNSYFVVKAGYALGDYTNFAPTGTCQATWVDMR